MIAALDASAFDWSLIGRPVTVQIYGCGCAGSRPGVVVLDETMLASSPYGRAYAWGIVQHEFAHQVLWYALDDRLRSELQALLGGADLCYEQAGLPHDAHSCELFASTLGWAYSGRSPAIRCKPRRSWEGGSSGVCSAGCWV